MALKLERYLIYIIIVTCVFFSSDKFMLNIINPNFRYIYFNFNIIDICLLLMMIIFLSIKLNQKNIQGKLFFLNKENKLMAFMLLLNLCLFFYSIIISLSYGFNFLTRIERYNFYYCIIFVIISNLNFTKLDITKIFNFFVLTVFTKYSLGIYDYIFRAGNFSALLGKVVFLEGDTLAFGNLALAVSLMALVFKKGNNIINKNIYILQIVLFTLVILLSMRRTYIAGLFVVLGCSILYSTFKKKVKVILIIIIMFSIFINIAPMFSQVLTKDTVMQRIASINIFNKSLEQNKFTSDTGHWDDALDAWDNIVESPVMGKGRYTPVNRLRLSWQMHPTFFHVGVLSDWVSSGILGIVFDAALSYIIIKHSFKFTRKLKRNYLSLSYISIILIVIALSFTSGAPFLIYNYSLVIFILMGSVYCLNHNST